MSILLRRYPPFSLGKPFLILPILISQSIGGFECYIIHSTGPSDVSDQERRKHLFHPSILQRLKCNGAGECLQIHLLEVGKRRTCPEFGRMDELVSSDGILDGFIFNPVRFHLTP